MKNTKFRYVAAFEHDRNQDDTSRKGKLVISQLVTMFCFLN